MFITLTTTQFVQEPIVKNGAHTIGEKLVCTRERINTAHIIRYHELSELEIEQINRKGDRRVKARVIFANNSIFVRESAEEIDWQIDGKWKARVAQGGC